MPGPPNRVGRQSADVLGSIDDALVETPCKRRRCLVSGTYEPSPSHPSVAAASCTTSGWGALGAGVLAENAVAESLALLEAHDIARGAMVCTMWCQAARGRALWVLAASHLGLARRVVQRHEVSKRRSRGTLWRGMLIGEYREPVALRTVDLNNANAGREDGLLPSILREVAILRSFEDMKHPGIVQLLGIEIDASSVHIVTKYVESSFAAWFASPQLPLLQLRRQIRDRFWHLLEAVSFLHSKGIVHRNLTPPNVLLDTKSGSVKISDYAYGRVLDVPLRPYSPEDPKLRSQSTREARRLWYRAPELLLRQPIYGTHVDIWSVGCLLAEAARGQPIFPSESEIDHLFRVFRFTGTPGLSLWRDALSFQCFSAKFPVYATVDMREVARSACGMSKRASPSLDQLKRQRPEVHEFTVHCGCVLGMDGAELMQSLLHLEPDRRCTAKEAMKFAFIRRHIGGHMFSSTGCKTVATTPCRTRSRQETFNLSAYTPIVSRDDDASQESLGTQAAIGLGRIRLIGSPASQCCGPASDNNHDAMWPPLWAEMARLDASVRAQVLVPSSDSEFEMALIISRAEQVDHMISLAKQLNIGDFALHLGVALLDVQRRAKPDGIRLEPFLIAVACLKLADAFDEHSNEYYQRDKTSAYASATKQRWSAKEIIDAEKCIAKRTEFRLHRTTSSWFLRICLQIGGDSMKSIPDLVATARFMNDMALFDPELMRQPAALRAQAALLLASFVVLSAGAAQTGMSKVVALWEPIRLKTCFLNRQDTSELCFAHMVRAFTSMRKEWTAHGLRAVQERHLTAHSKQMPPDGVPKDLVLELLYDKREKRAWQP